MRRLPTAIVPREISPLDAAVVTVGYMQSPPCG
jgi:hypothetical protein